MACYIICFQLIDAICIEARDRRGVRIVEKDVLNSVETISLFPARVVSFRNCGFLEPPFGISALISVLILILVLFFSVNTAPLELHEFDSCMLLYKTAY